MSAGQLGFSDEMMLDRLGQRMMSSVPTLEPAQLVDAVSSVQ